jgi:hypothetical protein
VSELIQKELDNGCIYGPFCKPAFEHYRVSPLGVTTGKYSHKRRLILDLSVPHSDDVASINDLIDKGQCSMSYIKIDHAVKLLQNMDKAQSYVNLIFKMPLQHIRLWDH